MEKITFQELKDRRLEWETAVIVFTEDSFDKPYTEVQRSYRLSDNSMWGLDSTKMGNRISGDCLDGSDLGVRLDHYMNLEDYDKRWKVDYCYIESVTT